MPAYYQNLITVTVEEFEAAGNSRRGKVMATISWDSGLLDTVRATLAAYWKNPGPDSKRELQRVVQRWHAEKPSEFRNRDRISNGVCTRLLEDVATADRARGVQSVILYGDKNPQATKLTVPHVRMDDWSVISLMMYYRASGLGVGVIVIDLYGRDFRAQGLDRRYDGGDTVLENMIEVLRFARRNTINGKRIPVINFVMGKFKTIDEIVKELPPWTISMTKPTHNSFDNTKLDETMQATACKSWVIFGFNANQCVAATIFGSESTTKVKKTISWEDEIGNTLYKYEMKWCPGALDRGYHVITSRLILASQAGFELSQKEGWPNLGPTNR